MIFSRRGVLAGGMGLATGAARAQQLRDTLRIGVLAPRGLGTLDPHFATAHTDRMLASWLHGALVRFRPGSISPAEIEPDLAESWEASADRRVWTFRLREGVEFHRGFGPVTAEDAAFSLSKAADAQRSAHAQDFAAVEQVTALDVLTLRIILARPIPSLPGLVANYAGGFILSRRAMEQGGPDAAAVGFGPFRLVRHSPGQSAELAAHDGYFRGRPRLRRIEYRFLAAPATGDLAFRAGELDIVEGPQDQAWINRTRQTPDATVDVIEPAELSLLHLNVTQPPLDDPRVRRAVALAVNRPELAAWRGGDLARAGAGVIPARYLGFARDIALPGTDIAAARRLLAEAGHPNGLTLRTIHTQSPVMLGAIQVVQAQLRRAGIALEVQVVDHLTYHQMIRQGLSPVVHYAAARFPVADVMLTQFFSTAGGPTNFSRCTVADSDLDAARAEADPERQLEHWAAAQRAILAADCAVPLLESLQVWARRAAFDYGFAFRGSMSTGPLVTELSGFRG